LCSNFLNLTQYLYVYIETHNNTTGATCGAGIACPSEEPEFSPVVSGVRITRSLVLCVMFCRSLFVLLSFFFWPFCCLLFLDLRILITPLVLSTSSISCHDHKRKMVHVINSSSKVRTLHTGKTIQENALILKGRR